MLELKGCPIPAMLIALKRGHLRITRSLVQNHVASCDHCSREYLALESLDKREDEEIVKELLDEHFRR